MTKPTLKSIAEQLDLTPTTISRVLSGKGDQYRISQQTQKRIRELAERLNYSPDHIARGLRLKKTSTIALIVPDIANPYFATIAHHITAEARKRGHSVLLSDSQENTQQEIDAIKVMESRNVDGMIICPVGDSSTHLEKFVDGSKPVVLADRYYKELNIPSVSSDNTSGAREATEYLLDHGHRRIACLQGLPKSLPNQDRIAGYREALQEHFDEQLIVGDNFSKQSGYVAARTLLRAEAKFTAIFALNNQIALGALQALAEEGLGIPEDVSIITFDDFPYAEYLATPMTTVKQRNEEMGQIAAQMLFSQLDSQKASQGLLLPTQLIERASVRHLNA